jgi:hypothetical protein
MFIGQKRQRSQLQRLQKEWSSLLILFHSEPSCYYAERTKEPIAKKSGLLYYSCSIANYNVHCAERTKELITMTAFYSCSIAKTFMFIVQKDKGVNYNDNKKEWSSLLFLFHSEP